MQPSDGTRTIEAAARRLLGKRPAWFGAGEGPSDVEQGYAVQDLVWRGQAKEIGGYKIGLTSSAAQRAMGATGPAAGRLRSDRILRGFSRIPVGADHLRIVEPELVFVLASDLVPRERPFTAEDVLAAVGSIHAGIEICDTRYDPDYDPSLAELVADNVNADWLVIGDRLADASASAIAATPVRVSCRGLEDVEGSTANVLGNPIEAMLWLAGHLASRGEALRAGMVIASGSCAGMIEVPPREIVIVQFGNSALAAARLLEEQSDLGKTT